MVLKAWLCSLGFVVAAVPRSWACETVDLASLTVKARQLDDDGAPSDALGLLEAAWSALPEACNPVSPASLAEAAFQAGAIATYSGLPTADELSRQWMFRAAHLVNQPACPAMHGERACAVWVEVAASVSDRGSAVVVAEQDLWLDGVALAEGATMSVPAGPHLLQFAEHGTWFSVDSGGRWGIPSGRYAPPPPSSHPPPWGPVVLTAVGAAIGGAGAGIWYGTYWGPVWRETCTNNNPTNEPFPSTAAGLRACAAFSGRPVFGQVVTGAALVGLGGGAVIIGGSWLMVDLRSARRVAGTHPPEGLAVVLSPGRLGLSGKF